MRVYSWPIYRSLWHLPHALSISIYVIIFGFCLWFIYLYEFLAFRIHESRTKMTISDCYSRLQFCAAASHQWARDRAFCRAVSTCQGGPLTLLSCFGRGCLDVLVTSMKLRTREFTDKSLSFYLICWIYSLRCDIIGSWIWIKLIDNISWLCNDSLKF